MGLIAERLKAGGMLAGLAARALWGFFSIDAAPGTPPAFVPEVRIESVPETRVSLTSPGAVFEPYPP